MESARILLLIRMLISFNDDKLQVDMMKRFRLTVFGVAMITLLAFNHCADDEFSVCAGCDADAPWSAPGAGKCYYSSDDCEAALGRSCTVCD